MLNGYVQQAELPPIDLIMGRAGGENFPVAMRILPESLRQDLLTIYGWARLIDQLGDDYPGDRLAALDLVEHQLISCLEGKSEGCHQAVRQIAQFIERHGCDTAPMIGLIEANRQDQVVHSYSTFEELVDYCHLSADTVGHMVLIAFGAYNEVHVALSNLICTALQLVEHWQDVAEDAVAGRIYLPKEDLDRFGVNTQELIPKTSKEPASAEFRALMAFEVSRARRLLREGSPLVRSLGGRAGLAVAGFTAGGHASLDAIVNVDFDVITNVTRPSPSRMAFRLATVLADSKAELPSKLRSSV